MVGKCKHIMPESLRFGKSVKTCNNHAGLDGYCAKHHPNYVSPRLRKNAK